jgi:hypothetical protein
MAEDSPEFPTFLQKKLAVTGKDHKILIKNCRYRDLGKYGRIGLAL